MSVTEADVARVVPRAGVASDTKWRHHAIRRFRYILFVNTVDIHMYGQRKDHKITGIIRFIDF